MRINQRNKFINKRDLVKVELFSIILNLMNDLNVNSVYCKLFDTKVCRNTSII